MSFLSWNLTQKQDQICTNEPIEGFHSIMVVKVHAVPRKKEKRLRSFMNLKGLVRQIYIILDS